MYLREFVDSCNERYMDPDVLEGVSNSPYLARTAACSIVELINRGFDVFDFIELIYYENSFYEQCQCFKMVSSDVDDLDG